MKFVVNSKQLFDKLQKLGKVINSKNTLPILDNFLFIISGLRLKIVATDIETRVGTEMEISEVDGDGKIAINAQQIANALKDIPNQPITIEINLLNYEISISYENGKFLFIGVNPQEYPDPRKLKDELSFSIESDVLSSCIEATLFASASDELRPILNGVLLDITPDSLTFVATDGHKMIKVQSDQEYLRQRGSFVLVQKTARILQGLLPKKNETISVMFDLNTGVFKMSDFIITCRFVEGRFPNYESVIPKENRNVAKMSKDQLLAVLKRVSVFSNPASNLVKLDFSSNGVIASSQDIDFSTSAEELLPCEYDGEPLIIGFKASFLLEILSHLQSDDIAIKMSTADKAALIIPSSTNISTTSLIMPLMLTD